MDIRRRDIIKTFGKPLNLRGAARFARDKIKEPLMIAEVGVADGRNALMMLREMNIERLYLVDSYPDYMDGPFIRKGEIQEAYYNAMLINIQEYLSKVVLITRDSIFASTLFEKGTFDFVYVDGFHSYSSTKRDIEAWWPLVKEGGVLGGHDIGHVNFPGVAKAVEGFSRKISKEFKTVGDSDWIIEKG